MEDNGAKCHMASNAEQPQLSEEPMMVQVSKREDIVSSYGNIGIEPRIGMEFESAEAAKTFYDAYGEREGFTIRSSTSYRCRHDMSIISRKFVCSREGYHIRRLDPRSKTKRPRQSFREGCMAFMSVKKQPAGQWIVVEFAKQHNHELVVTLRNVQSQCLQLHDFTPETEKMQGPIFHEVDIASSGIPQILKEESHGMGNDCVIQLNFKNYQKSPQRTLGRDTASILEYFKKKQAKNPSFFYAIQINEGQCVMNVFWADARSRMAHKYFGDVITLDTTYKINQSQITCALFAGVNHHGQSILFGCAILSDDSEYSYMWLFNTYLAAMSGHHPIAITTVRHQSIGAAVAQVFPGSRHRFCKQHILREMPEALYHESGVHQNFKEEMHECINLADTIDDFETGWQSLLSKYDLIENEWLQSLYVARRQWIPVYLHDTFFAEISTAQQTERENSFFDGYVNAQTSIQEFIKQYEKAMDSWYEKEAEADFETIHCKPLLKTSSPMEKQAADIYTREIFMKFQGELFETLAYMADKFEGNGVMDTYRVAKYGENNKAYTVTFDASEIRTSCSCQMFEFSGIPCKHILTVFKVVNVLTLPSHYILERWTRNAKSGVVLDEGGVEFQDSNCHETFTIQYNNLCQIAIKCAEEGASSSDIYTVALCALREALDKVVAAKNSSTRIMCQGDVASKQNPEDNTIEGSQAVTLPDPDITQLVMKGYSIKKSVRKIRTCRMCRGPNHDSRVCPLSRDKEPNVDQDNQMGQSFIIAETI